jgi:hypothetical protein
MNCGDETLLGCGCSGVPCCEGRTEVRVRITVKKCGLHIPDRIYSFRPPSALLMPIADTNDREKKK